MPGRHAPQRDRGPVAGPPAVERGEMKTRPADAALRAQQLTKTREASAPVEGTEATEATSTDQTPVTGASQDGVEHGQPAFAASLTEAGQGGDGPAGLPRGQGPGGPALAYFKSSSEPKEQLDAQQQVVGAAVSFDQLSGDWGAKLLRQVDDYMKAPDRFPRRSPERDDIGRQIREHIGLPADFAERVNSAVAKLDDDDKKALSSYSGRYAYYVNGLLKGDPRAQKLEGLQLEKTRFVKEQLPRAMQKLVKYTGVMFRGGDLPPRVAPADDGGPPEVGDVVRTPQFMSSSVSFPVVEDVYLAPRSGDPTLLIINAKDAAAVPADTQTNQFEQETLLLPGSEFRVAAMSTLESGLQVYILDQI